jgi:ComF family protein
MGGVLAWLKDALFPKFCVSCRAEGVWLCEKCREAIVITEKLSTEKQNLTAPHLDGVTALFYYGNNNISKLIGMLKYGSISELGEDIMKIISASNFDLPYNDFVLIPVPLHIRRQRERGFNQAMILANAFAKKLNYKICADLRRLTYTAQQAKLSAADRKVNLNGAFVFENTEAIVPERVLLVDDVFTTGATMSECGKALKNRGVKVVWGLALAHGG